jgi:putative transposase
MRQKHPEESLGSLCELFGVTRQAYYDAAEHERNIDSPHAGVVVG